MLGIDVLVAIISIGGKMNELYCNSCQFWRRRYSMLSDSCPICGKQMMIVENKDNIVESWDPIER